MGQAENEAKCQERGVGFEESGDERIVGFVGVKRGGTEQEEDAVVRLLRSVSGTEGLNEVQDRGWVGSVVCAEGELLVM